jgi:hypothetical protein
VVLVALWCVQAAELATEVKTTMTTVGKVRLTDDLAKPFGKEWKVGKGKWVVAEGEAAICGAELKEDK